MSEYRDDPRWQAAHARLIGTDTHAANAEERLAVAIAAAYELRSIEQEYTARRAA